MDDLEIDDEIMAQIAEHGHAIFEIVDKNPGYSAAVYAGKANPKTEDVQVYTAANGDYGVILECMYVDVMDSIKQRNDMRMLFSLISLVEAVRHTIGDEMFENALNRMNAYHDEAEEVTRPPLKSKRMLH